MKDIKIEKLILLTTILFGLILFIDYVFGISNLIHIYDSKIDRTEEMVLKRDTFLHLYSVSLIPVLIFYGQCNFQRIVDKDAEPEIFSAILQPFITFIIGYILFEVLGINYLRDIMTTEYKVIVVIIIQFIFFAKTLSWINSKASKLFKPNK